MSITINGATNTLTAASGLTIAGNTAVTGTLTASGNVTFTGATIGILNVNATGTNATRLSLLNDGGQYFFGADNSTGAGFGGTAYAQVIYAPAGRVVETSIAGTGVITKVSSTGLAVTGTLSASGVTSVTDTTDATSTTSASLKTAGGLGVAKKAYFGDNIGVNVTTIPAWSAYKGIQIGAQGSVVYSGGALILGSNWYYSAGGIKYIEAAEAAFLQMYLGKYDFYTAPAGSADAVMTATSKMTLSNLGVLTLANTTDASATTTAALVVSGGVGIAKKTYCGDNIVMASGKGIDFSATSDGSGTTTSEVLSDYEEGTWTPALTWSTPGDQSFAYSTQTGTYTKVGRLVTCSVAIVTSTHTYSTATGALQISGLPFTAGATAYECASAHFAGITKASYTAVGLQVGSSSTVASLVASGSGQAVANIVPANVPSGTQVTYRATFSYIV